jgi:hypothetical protein
VGFKRSTSPKTFRLVIQSVSSDTSLSTIFFVLREHSQHKGYVKDDMRDDFKMYPQWDDKLAEQNG